jgi:hypothetical protein
MFLTSRTATSRYTRQAATVAHRAVAQNDLARMITLNVERPLPYLLYAQVGWISDEEDRVGGKVEFAVASV